MTLFVNINFDTLDHELKLQKAVQRHVSTDPLHIPGTNAAIWEAWPCIHHNWNTRLTPVPNTQASEIILFLSSTKDFIYF